MGCASSALAKATGSPIVYAGYGGADVTAKVISEFSSQQALKWSADGTGAEREYSTVLGDSYPDDWEDFIVVSLDNSVTPNEHRVNWYDSYTDDIDIVPGPGDSETCDATVSVADIISANFGGQDVTAKMQELWNACDNQLVITDFKGAFGDPASGVLKALVIFYLYQSDRGQERAAAFWWEGDTCTINYNGQ